MPGDISDYLDKAALPSIGTSAPANYDLSEMIKQQAAAKLENDLANLKYAYDDSRSTYDAAAKRIPKTDKI